MHMSPPCISTGVLKNYSKTDDSHLSLTILSSLYLGLFCLSRRAAPPSFLAIAFFSFRTKCYKKTMDVWIIWKQNTLTWLFKMGSQGYLEGKVTCIHKKYTDSVLFIDIKNPNTCTTLHIALVIPFSSRSRPTGNGLECVVTFNIFGWRTLLFSNHPYHADIWASWLRNIFLKLPKGPFNISPKQGARLCKLTTCSARHVPERYWVYRWKIQKSFKTI